MKKINVVILIISVSFIFNISYSQDSKQWEQITEKDGLPSDIVYGIFLDSKGHNWIISKKGISKFDGKQWQHFTKKNGLPTSNFYRLILNSKGNHWIIHEKGISRYDGRDFIPIVTLKIKNYIMSFVDRQSNIWIIQARGKIIIYNGEKLEIVEKKDMQFSKCYLVDSKENVWIAGISRNISTPWWSYLYIFDGKKWSKYPSITGLPSDHILCIYEDNKGDIWIGMESGLYKKENNNKSLFVKGNEESWPDEKPVRKIFQDNFDNLYVFMSKYYGFGEYKHAIGKIMKLIGDTWESSPEISFRYFGGSLQDSKGNIWIGYDNGVFKYDGSKFIKYNKELGLDDAKPETYTTKLYEDSKGNIWIGSTIGICRYDSENWKCFSRSIKSKSNVNPNGVTSICEDSKGNLLIGTYKGVFIYNY
ncbi:MAG: hypothetical protein K8R74_08235 [Bacteroidales bacterium]|nr:hypothetical protein [Bacteroidales bacterium]